MTHRVDSVAVKVYSCCIICIAWWTFTKSMGKNRLSNSVQIKNPYTNVLKTAKTVSLNSTMFGKGYGRDGQDFFACTSVSTEMTCMYAHSRTHQHHCPQIKSLWMMLRFWQGKWNWLKERRGRPFRYATSTWPSTTAKATRSCQGCSVPITWAQWSCDSIKSPLSNGCHQKLVIKITGENNQILT